MSSLLYPPQRPEREPAPFTVPRIYISEPMHWEYRQLARDLQEEGELDDAALNELGADGWELAAAVPHAQKMTYIFKRRTA